MLRVSCVILLAACERVPEPLPPVNTPAAMPTGEVVQSASCEVATDCEGNDGACSARACVDGVCTRTNASAGTLAGVQTTGNCQRMQCDGAGAIVSAADDEDMPDDGNPCTTETCLAGALVTSNVGSGTSCGGGLSCDGSGHCAGCTSPTMCPQGDACKTATCSDQVCGFAFAATGAPGNSGCLFSECDGAGNSVCFQCNTPADCGADPVCATRTCVNRACGLANSEPGVPCAGGVCNGGGACVGCTEDAQCPTANACQLPSCATNVCGVIAVTGGEAPSGLSQTTGDCKRVACDGAGAPTSFVDDADVPVDDGNVCTQDICSAGVPYPPVADGTGCGILSSCQNGVCVFLP